MNETFPREAQEIMNERFGHDTLIGLATIRSEERRVGERVCLYV